MDCHARMLFLVVDLMGHHSLVQKAQKISCHLQTNLALITGARSCYYLSSLPLLPCFNIQNNLKKLKHISLCKSGFQIKVQTLLNIVTMSVVYTIWDTCDRVNMKYEVIRFAWDVIGNYKK